MLVTSDVDLQLDLYLGPLVGQHSYLVIKAILFQFPYYSFNTYLSVYNHSLPYNSRQLALYLQNSSVCCYQFD